MGPTVPTKIVGTANGGFLLAVPTNLSEQYTFYNAASIIVPRGRFSCISADIIGEIYKKIFDLRKVISQSEIQFGLKQLYQLSVGL